MLQLFGALLALYGLYIILAQFYIFPRAMNGLKSYPVKPPPKIPKPNDDAVPLASQKTVKLEPVPEEPTMPDLDNPMAKMMLSNPEMMLSMMPPGPEKDQMQEMLKIPAFRTMFTDPDTIQQMMQMGKKHN